MTSLPQLPGANLLTHSRMQSYKTCPRKHYFAYELGIRPETDAAALRIGGCVHRGIEARAKGASPNDAIHVATQAYSIIPDWAKSDEQQREWMYERETAAAMLAGYFWFWESAAVPPELRIARSIASELPFELPIRNPETGSATPTFRQAGKIDDVVELHDTRIAVKEIKTAGDDIGPGADYWKRLRIDHQISTYLLAARESGHNAQTVLYDVLRKPTIRPTGVAIVEDGAKVVLDRDGVRVRTKDGKKWRETGDSDLGYTLQTRPMTSEEWGKKLLDDITARPEFYYARQEIPRLDADLEEFRHELWQTQQQIRDAQKNGRWFRNTSACIGFGKCAYFDICTNGVTVDPANPPSGFRRVEHLHPELSTGD